MKKFLLLSKGLFFVSPLSLYELIQCRRMREEFSFVLTAQGEEPRRARELAGAISLCFFSLKPIFARQFRSPEQVYRTLTLTQLEKIAGELSRSREDMTVEFGCNEAFAKEVKEHGCT